MSKIILCITDKPGKFKKLRELLFIKDIVLITSCRTYHVLEYLRGPQNLLGIALDFEMPFGTGVMFARYLKEEGITSVPIIVTENDKYGSKRVKETLEELGYDLYVSISYDEDNWEERAIDFWNLNSVSEIFKISSFISNC